MGTETILRFFSIFPYVFQHGLVCSFFSFFSFIFLFYFFSGHFQNFSSMNEFGCLFVHTTTSDFVYVCVCLCMSVYVCVEITEFVQGSQFHLCLFFFILSTCR